MPRVRIGQNCIVGAATLVRQDVPDDSVIVGVPGRILAKKETPRKQMDS
jgi:acetyltransferase-like isoleucine patch superfamily enzyme